MRRIFEYAAVFRQSSQPSAGRTESVRNFSNASGNTALEIVLELVRALEIGEYAVSKYIPPYLGQIFHMLEGHEQLYVLNQMQYLLESQEKQTVLAGLETAGAILKYAPEFMVSAECERLTGFLCMGMASDQMEVSQEAFYIAGHDLFGQNELGSEQKSVFFQLLARKILSLLNWNKLGVYAYFYGAALNIFIVLLTIMCRKLEKHPC